MSERQKKPDWIKVKINLNDNFRFVDQLLSKKNLNTVCEEARCPNIHECWGEHRTATFMILGDTCTRRCRFCSVKTGLPGPVDTGEPQRVADSVAEMGLAHVVITMVNRDDLDDGGAGIMAQTVAAIKQTAPNCKIEVLASDMMGKAECIRVMLDAQPDIMSHNIETVERLTPTIRSRSDYRRSLTFLELSHQLDPDIVTKSSMMLGLGETAEEIEKALDDLRSVSVSCVNLGQYLQPTPNNLPVQKYWTPDEFMALKEMALGKGFIHVESGPLVRSSYHAGEQLAAYQKRKE
ncbi:lipoyl synthase [Planctomycetota bacterium]